MYVYITCMLHVPVYYMYMYITCILHVHVMSLALNGHMLQLKICRHPYISIM